MKKILLLVALAMLIPAGSLFAQQNSHVFRETDIYYFNVPIERIYTHRLGYIVVYRVGGTFRLNRTFIPMEWFHDVAGRAQMIGLGAGREWPSMSVFYKGGEFSHVRLRVRRHRAHESWSVVPLTVNIDEYFQGIEEVRLEF